MYIKFYFQVGALLVSKVPDVNLLYVKGLMTPSLAVNSEKHEAYLQIKVGSRDA
jgi:hypothetical protein